MIVCADDYGLRTDIDAAILQLCEMGKLSAVSCMVALESCTPALLSDLGRYEKSLDIGLHVCLTAEGVPWAPSVNQVMSSVPRYGTLLKRSFMRSIDEPELHRQISVQYSLFVEKMGRAPDHIDGHLHSHQLPGVREALIQFVLGLPEDRRPYLRNTAMAIKDQYRHRLPWMKAFLIGFFGNRFRKRLIHVNLRTNRGFTGIYDFRKYQEYASYLPKFAECLVGKPDGILVVHPGGEEDWRKQEYAALKDFAFASAPSRFRQEVA